ncbi:uncharacterized protein [Antedon mediterranea]|uniref:uncharacterized protein isoform X2 n=1 Tax=Antedon mediterranea TaxID=105859 RepID=UPI003AF8412E
MSKVSERASEESFQDLPNVSLKSSRNLLTKELSDLMMGMSMTRPTEIKPYRNQDPVKVQDHGSYKTEIQPSYRTKDPVKVQENGSYNKTEIQPSYRTKDPIEVQARYGHKTEMQPYKTKDPLEVQAHYGHKTAMQPYKTKDPLQVPARYDHKTETQSYVRNDPIVDTQYRRPASYDKPSENENQYQVTAGKRTQTLTKSTDGSIGSSSMHTAISSSTVLYSETNKSSIISNPGLYNQAQTYKPLSRNSSNSVKNSLHQQYSENNSEDSSSAAEASIQRIHNSQDFAVWKRSSNNVDLPERSPRICRKTLADHFQNQPSIVSSCDSSTQSVTFNDGHLPVKMHRNSEASGYDGLNLNGNIGYGTERDEIPVKDYRYQTEQSTTREDMYSSHYTYYEEDDPYSCLESSMRSINYGQSETAAGEELYDLSVIVDQLEASVRHQVDQQIQTFQNNLHKVISEQLYQFRELLTVQTSRDVTQTVPSKTSREMPSTSSAAFYDDNNSTDFQQIATYQKSKEHYYNTTCI